MILGHNSGCPPPYQQGLLDVVVQQNIFVDSKCCKPKLLEIQRPISNKLNVCCRSILRLPCNIHLTAGSTETITATVHSMDPKTPGRIRPGDYLKTCEADLSSQVLALTSMVRGPHRLTYNSPVLELPEPAVITTRYTKNPREYFPVAVSAWAL